MSDAQDDQYAEAKHLVFAYRKPSPAFISRKLGVKWTDAERLMKRMAKEGLIEGPFMDSPTFRMRPEELA